MFSTVTPYYQTCLYALRSYLTTLRTFTILFCIFNLLILISGTTISIFALAWYSNTTYLSLVLTPIDIYTSLAVGVVLCSTFFISIPPIITSYSRGKNRPEGLFALSFLLAVDILLVIAGASIVWYKTLRERNTFWEMWESSSELMRGSIQDSFECCGYWSSTDLTQVVPLNQCSDPTIAALQQPCVNPFQAYGDGYLNGISTFIYGVAAILCFQFLITACLVSHRKLLERYRKIDLKQKIVV